VAHKNASRETAKARRRIHDDAKPAAAARLPDATDHTFALIQARVSERAKVELTRVRTIHGLTESAMLRKIVYEYLDLVPTKE